LDFLTEEEYLDILETLPKENQYLEDSDPNKFIAKMGAEALWDLLSQIGFG
jgi:DNA-directed RNA polymerase subunit beta'